MKSGWHDHYCPKCGYGFVCHKVTHCNDEFETLCLDHLYQKGTEKGGKFMDHRGLEESIESLGKTAMSVADELVELRKFSKTLREINKKQSVQLAILWVQRAEMREALQAAERHLSQQLADERWRDMHPINKCPVLDQVRAALEPK